MRIDIQEREGVMILRPEDRLDIVGYLELEEVLAEQLRRGNSRLVLDLEEATFINSSALAVLSRFWADCARVGGALVVARPSREASNFLRLGDLHELMEVHPTLEAAVGAALAAAGRRRAATSGDAAGDDDVEPRARP
jgi:anti-sigma B factor antagonist